MLPNPHRRPRRSLSILGQISFSADSRLMSIKDDNSTCSVVKTGTWRTLCRLASPLDELIERCGLSRSGRYFAAVGTRGEIYVWDLQGLDRELTALGLGVPQLNTPSQK